MKQLALHIAPYCFSLILSFAANAQESIFTGFKSDSKKAEECYQNQAFGQAIQLYGRQIEKNPASTEVIQKLANCYFLYNDMQNAVGMFGEYEKLHGQFSSEEELRYATALHATGKYDEAISRLTNYQKKFPDNMEISRKIWQLQNIHFLQEDSAYFIVDKLNINTQYDEFGPVVYGNSMVFISNRERVTLIKRVNAEDDKPFFSWFTTAFTNISGNKYDLTSQDRVPSFAKEIKSKYHKGSIDFTFDEKLMVYSRVVGDADNGQKTSMLFFAENVDGKWQETSSFPYNSSVYSVMHPHFSLNGKRLYFSSDMSGGYGNMDLYYVDFQDGRWKKPINLGETINTSQNEGHPFIADSILYFSSNGHAGLGGIDIFHVDLVKRTLEVINQGYPVNTFHDDFNMVLFNNGSNGFFCSNRDQNLNMGDDIFSVRFTKLSFPLLVSGKISYKKSELTERESGLIDLSNADIELVNKESQETVIASTTDGTGKFSIEIPYESQFLLRVRQQELGVAIVSMEIPKNHQDYLNHDIVIVQDLFNILQKQNESNKEPPGFD